MKTSEAYVIPGIKNMDELIAEAFMVTVSEIKSKDRKGPGKDARFFAMWYLKMNTDLSYEKIGERYNGRDHCTVLHACKKVDFWLDNNKIYKAKASKALEKLKNVKVE